MDKCHQKRDHFKKEISPSNWFSTGYVRFFLGGRVNKSSNTQLFKAFFLFGSDPGNPFTSGFRGLSSSYSSSIAHHIGSKILLYLAVLFQNISNVVEFGCFFSGELDRGHYMYIIYIYISPDTHANALFFRQSLQNWSSICCLFDSPNIDNLMTHVRCGRFPCFWY